MRCGRYFACTTGFRELCLFTFYQTLGSPSRTRVSGLGQSEELREKCSIGHAGQSEQTSQGEGFTVHRGRGHSLAPPTHPGDVSPPPHLTQTRQQQGKPSLEEGTQHRFPWAEKQVPHTLSHLPLLCLFPLVPVPPSLVPRPC